MNSSKTYIIELAKKNKRNSEDRKIDEFRDITITADESINAEGSTRVQIGKTIVIAGVKMTIGTPYPDSPDRGNLICSGELNPIADSSFEPGRPGENAIELSRVVDRGIRESESINLKKLCIIEGEKVWNVFVDFYILNNGGNLIDACGIAAIAALKRARIPKLDENDNVLYGDLTNKKIPFNKIPIPTTFVKIGDQILVDPDNMEESEMQARLTVTSSNNEINALQKGGEDGLTIDEIEYCLSKSFKIREKIVELIEKIK